jgi:hypothetical protein
MRGTDHDYTHGRVRLPAAVVVKPPLDLRHALLEPLPELRERPALGDSWLVQLGFLQNTCHLNQLKPGLGVDYSMFVLHLNRSRNGPELVNFALVHDTTSDLVCLVARWAEYELIEALTAPVRLALTVNCCNCFLRSKGANLRVWYNSVIFDLDLGSKISV